MLCVVIFCNYIFREKFYLHSFCTCFKCWALHWSKELYSYTIFMCIYFYCSRIKIYDKQPPTVNTQAIANSSVQFFLNIPPYSRKSIISHLVKAVGNLQTLYNNLFYLNQNNVNLGARGTQWSPLQNDCSQKMRTRLWTYSLLFRLYFVLCWPAFHSLPSVKKE